MSHIHELDKTSELERIRLYTLSARQRIRRLDVLLDEQIQVLRLDPALRSSNFLKRAGTAYRFGRIEVKVFLAAFTVAALTSFYAGYWISHR